MSRAIKPRPAHASLLLLVDAAFREAAAANGVLVPHLWSDQSPKFLIDVPDDEWVQQLQHLLHRSGARPWLCSTYHDDPGRFLDMFIFEKLSLGRAVWIAAPGDAVPDLVREQVDHHVVIGGLTSTAIRTAIAAFTGKTINVEDADWQGLRLVQVAAALQAAPNAAAVVTHLRRLL